MQSVIPLLKQSGVAAITVGVNGGSAPPALPDAFVWKHGEDSILGMYHPGGYGGTCYTPKARTVGSRRVHSMGCVVVMGQ